jgi:hypothetical protein
MSLTHLPPILRELLAAMGATMEELNTHCIIHLNVGVTNPHRGTTDFRRAGVVVWRAQRARTVCPDRPPGVTLTPVPPARATRRPTAANRPPVPETAGAASVLHGLWRRRWDFDFCARWVILQEMMSIKGTQSFDVTDSPNRQVESELRFLHQTQNARKSMKTRQKTAYRFSALIPCCCSPGPGRWGWHWHRHRWRQRGSLGGPSDQRPRR